MKYCPAVRPTTAVRRIVLPLVACVFTLHWAAAQAPAPSAPGAPSGLVATAGNRSIALTWDDPSDGNIAGYEFRVHADREPDWREWKAISGSTHETTDHTLPALTNGVLYRVQVRARNAAGAGEPSETSAEPQAPAAASPPGAPDRLTATPGDGTISLTWDDPSDASITGYEFRVHADRESDWREWKSISGSTHETTDHRLYLTNGVRYRVQVRARNAAGAGESSETSAEPQAPAAEPAEDDRAEDAPVADAPPGAPNRLAAAAGDGTISLAWDDPSDASITGYEFRVHAVDRESDWREWKAIAGSTHETTDHRLDLTNGVLYRVQVRARNSAGTGEPSEASAEPQAPAAEPAEDDRAEDAPVADAPPGAPNRLAAAAGDGTISLAWDDPSDASITGYEFRVHAVDRESDWREWKAIAGSTHETTDHRLDLTNGVLYRVQVRARNSAGTGEPSEASAEPQAPDGGAPSSVGAGEETDAPDDSGAASQPAEGAPSSVGAGEETDAPDDSGAASQPAEGAPSSAGESPRSGVPWIVIVVLAVCLAIGIAIAAVRLRGTARRGAES